MKNLKTLLTTLVLALLAGTALSSAAQTAADPAQTAAPAGAALTDGEIRKIDRETGKLTIRHGDIKHLNMPSMTMVFVVKDKALLDPVKVGDKISFMVIMEKGRMVVTEIRPAP